MSEDSPLRIVLGRISAAHGLSGEVRVATFTAVPEAIADYGPLADDTGAQHTIAAMRAIKGGVIARLKGVATRDAAERLAGRMLSVARTALPPPDDEEYYHADLIGLEACSQDGTAAGHVIAVHDFGAGQMLEIRAEGDRASRLVAFTRAAVPDVDIAGGRITLAPETET